MSRAQDSDVVGADTLRRLSIAGYVPADRGSFQARLSLLAEPKWYGVQDVPRVRAVDPGVSRLRYVVSLDECLCAGDAEATQLWEHFLGCDYRTSRT